ncbi:unnamed protein product [Paramecium octaurelia]|uniref:Uncharacterized protein n=1 Tax=Paramecium octaurelia TaxID=43137 RepID=A0A8S1UIU2_PAROT|nr:unnamed protein product [Paramecium octaurelia]
MITFENNMMRLCQLKAEAQELIEIQAQQKYNQLDANSLAQINQYRQEIDALKQQSVELQDHYEKQSLIFQQKINSLTEEIKLLNYENDKLENNYQNEIQELNSVIQQLQEGIQSQQSKFQKEIDNLKLMHSQELYILKKRK